MAISPIGVSFKSNYHAGFTGRKENKSSHGTSSLKAVPLVVLLAMSPLNNVNAQNLITGGKTVNEVTTNVDGTKSALFTYVEEDENAKSPYDDIKLIFKSDDGDNKPESVKYIRTSTMARTYRDKNGKDIRALRKQKEIYTCEALKTKIIHREDLYGKPYTTTAHYLLGGSIIISKFYDRNNPEIFLGSETAKNPNAIMGISESLYNQIADTMGDNIKYIHE